MTSHVLGLAARLRVARSRFVPAASCLLAFGLAAPLSAQSDPEPILDQVRSVFSQQGLTLGFLLQAVVDPGIETDPASAQIAAARIIVNGELDGGFNYRLQTNHAASPSLLDARVGWSNGDVFSVYAGRFKTPFSRELLTFAGSIDFVNRSRVVEALAPNRQIGMQIGGQFSEAIAWSVGGFTGATNATPNESLIGVVRLEGTDLEVGDGVVSAAVHAGVGRDGAVAARTLGTNYVGDGVLVGADVRYEGGALLLAGEFIRADWDPFAAPDLDSDGLYLTAGWMLTEKEQILARWDRYRSPVGMDDDVLVLGFNTWPTSATEVQVNWIVPFGGSSEIHKLLINFQVGF